MGIFTRFKRKVTEAGQALVVKGGNNVSTVLIDNISDDQRVEEFKVYERAYTRVPLITAIIDVTANQVVQDFFFEDSGELLKDAKKAKGDTKEAIILNELPKNQGAEDLNKWADKINLSQFFHKMTKSMLIYGNGYCEIIKEGDEVTQLKVIDSKWITVYREPTGDIMGYGQIIEKKHFVLWGTTGDKQIDKKFETHISKLDNQIAHFKHNVLGGDKYGMSIIKPLIPTLNSKLDMEENLKKVIFKYVAPLIVATVGNNDFPANPTAVADISNTLKDLQAESELTVSHLVDLKVLDFNAKGMDIATPMNHMDQQIITGGQVPPVLLSLTEKSDASDADVGIRGFGRRIKSIQREIANEFEDNIIVPLGLGTEDMKLKWEKTDERDWEVDVDILRGLVTDGILSPQKANDLMPPKYKEILPDPVEQAAKMAAATGANQGPPGENGPRPTQKKDGKTVKDNPNNPTKTTKNPRTNGKRVVKKDREEKK